MVELVLLVCLSNDPIKCKTVRLTLLQSESETPYQCLIAGQQKAVEWSAANPKWFVKRQSCARAKVFADI